MGRENECRNSRNRKIMKRIRHYIEENIKKLTRAGFFAIVFSNILVKVTAFCGGMLLVRVLSKYDYGVYSSVNNTLNMLTLLGDMGVGMAMMQLAQENYKKLDKYKAYCSYGLFYSIIFSLIPAVFILVSPLFYPYTIDMVENLTVALFGFPILYNLNNYLKTNLRIHLENKKYATINFLETLFNYIFLLLLTFFWGIKGAIVANYCYLVCICCLNGKFNRKILYLKQSYRRVLTRGERKQFFKLAIPSQLNSLIGQAMVLMDVFFIGIFLIDPEVIASYKVAATIPLACAFIPQCIMIFAVPYFARNNKNKEWVLSNTKKITCLSIVVCASICILGVATSSWLIPFLYGNQYKDSIIYYVILLIGFAFNGGIYIPLINIIYTQRKVKISLIITIICGIANVLLDIIGIKLWGAIGAAMATTIVQIIGALLTAGYCIWHLKKE